LLALQKEYVFLSITPILSSVVFVWILCQCLIWYWSTHTGRVYISTTKQRVHVFIQLVGIPAQGGTFITVRGTNIAWERNFTSRMLFTSISSIHLTLGNEFYWISVFILWKANLSVKTITQMETISKDFSPEVQVFLQGEKS